MVPAQTAELSSSRPSESLTDTTLTAVRSAGLPSSLLEDLSFTGSDALVTSILDTEEWLAGEGERLAQALHPLIGLADLSATDRRRLVNVRRCLFTSRDPAAGQWPISTPDKVPGAVAARVQAWLDVRGSATMMHERLSEVLAAELVQKADRLRQLASTVPFPRAIAAASPAVYEELQRWVAQPERIPKKQKLYRLSTYLVRAATKTSPFSFFTSSGLAHWVDGRAPLNPGIRGEPRAVLEADAGYLDHLARLLGRRDDLAAAVRLRLNPSARTSDSHVEFLGRPHRESLISVATTAPVQEVLALLGRYPEVSLAQCARALADATGASVTDANRYVGRLVDAGLIEVHLPVPDCAEDWLGSCGAWLGTQDSIVMRDIGVLLGAAAALIRLDIPLTAVDRHRQRCAEVRTLLDDAAARIGEGTNAPSPVLFENAVSTTHTGLGKGWWQPVLDDLEAVRIWLGIFDPHLPKRLAVTALHVKRFGSGSSIPFLSLYRAVVEEVVGRATEPPRPGTVEAAVAELFAASAPWDAQDALLELRGNGDAPFSELASLRRRARSLLLAGPGADRVVRIDPDLLAEQVRQWPSWLQSSPSMAFYVQLRAPETSDEVVLNAVHGGYGRAVARLRHLTGVPHHLASEPPDDARADRDPLVAVLAGRHGSTLNVHAPMTATEIAYPFTTGTATGLESLRLADLTATHDPTTGTVHLRCAGGRRVRPAHLGLTMAEFLPPAARFMLQVFGVDWLYHPASLMFVPFEELGTEATIVAYPRVAVGRVIIRRAGWLMSAVQVPRRRPAEGDAEFLLRLSRWLRAHGIPKKCFVRVWRADPGAASALTRAQARSRSAKPLFVDVANWLLIPPFERLTADASLVQFEEQLPVAGDAVRWGVDRFATEVVLELAAGSRS